jgi:hypothetical protein
MIDDNTAIADAAPETTASAATEAPSSNDGDSMHAEMARKFDEMNPSGETDGRTPPEAAQYSKSPEVETNTGDTEVASDITPPAMSKAGLAIWNSLSDEGKEYLANREQEFQRGMSSLGQEAKAGRDIAALFDEHRDVLPVIDGKPMDHANAVRHLLAADKMIRQDPVNAILHLAASSGVDLHQLLGAPPVPEGYASHAEIEQRAQALAQQYVQQHMQQQQWHQQQQQAAQLQQKEQYLTAEIERFAKDASRADHWHEAEDDIYREVISLKAQVAAGIEPARSEMDLLKLAYERATSRNPAIFVKTAEGREKAAQERKKADEAKRLASLNAKSKIGTAPRAAAQSMEATMTEVYERLHGRSY